MTPDQVLGEIKNGNPRSGWAVFPYNYKFAVSRIILRIIAVIGFSVASAALLITPVRSGKIYVLLGSAAFAIFAVIAIIMLLSVFIELFSAKNSFIVMTEEGIIKSFRGKTDFYPYDAVSGVKFQNPYGASTPGMARRREQFLDFTDNRTNKFVNLCRNRIFGPPENVYSVLQTYLSAGQKANFTQTYSNYNNI